MGIKTRPTLSTSTVHVDVNARMMSLLDEIMRGNSKVSSAAYDTAWGARLSADYTDQAFRDLCDWLRDNQHTDGSWGATIFHHHDRIVSTLAAIIALTEVGNMDDSNRIAAGEAFLWRYSTRLSHDANDTIGFPVLIVSLVRQAEALGLDIPQNLLRDAGTVRKKLNMLPDNPQQWIYTPLHYSLEALMHNVTDTENFDFGDAVGNVGSSPAASAATLMHPASKTARSHTYLLELIANQSDQGLPNVDQIDCFEAAWSLLNLAKAKLITPDEPAVKRILDQLWHHWSDETGASFSSTFRVHNLDDTAVNFEVLRWGGYPADPIVFEHYERDTHFICFPGEADPSLSAHLRALSALKYAQDAPQYGRWHDKIVNVLRHSDHNGYFWHDKWHVSPYYLTSPAICVLHGIMDDLLPSRIEWIEKSQRPDGGWGFYGQSTLEETAYCLQALMYVNTHIRPVDATVIKTGAAYFLTHLEDDYVALWIGKGLYTPYRVVESAIIATLHLLERYMN